MANTSALRTHRDEILAEMHGWIIDAFGMDAADACVSETEVMLVVARHYDGGIDQFISDQRF